ncbi:MAG: pyridoxal 5'-phosphate synthase glutaminase subunit PdxT [Alphaproteobacteria bacterium]|nr:pyridoxal 5'-phosphate synthase glutaminase subunit PdxT [Alphaproteobacteria bacterium]
MGVLALQGAIQLHRPHIEAAGGEYLPVRTAGDFERADAFILPGGESTTMLKLIDAFGLEETMRKAFAEKPVWGICAGAILLAETVRNPEQKSFGLLPITVTRNAYGRQLESIQQEIGGYPVSYIRAPVIEAVGPDVEVLAEREGQPVWVRRGSAMASTFHPELTLRYPSPMHRTFADLARSPLPGSKPAGPH